MTPSVAPRETARPASPDLPFDVEADVVVVGGGGGGLAAALFARWHGNEVVLLEKADELGGTTKKAAFWYWVPNNEPMQAIGIEDRKEDFLRYVARLSRPEAYDPEQPDARHEPVGVRIARGDLRQRLARRPSCSPRRARSNTGIAPSCPTTGPRSPRTRRRTAACWCPRTRCRRCRTAARWRSAPWRRRASATASTSAPAIACSAHRRRQGAVIGVEADTADGKTVRVKARKAVIFATGGFTHDVDLRKNFLSVPVFGGCAARDQRGRLRPHRRGGRRRAAQHELRLDVPDRAGEGAERRSGR